MEKVGQFMGSDIYTMNELSNESIPIVLRGEQWDVLSNIIRTHFGKLWVDIAPTEVEPPNASYNIRLQGAGSM